LNARSVNSGVKRCAAGDSLKTVMLRVATRAIEYCGELKDLAPRVTTLLNADARPEKEGVRSRRKIGAKSNNSLDASGISLHVIDNLLHDAIDFRRVNSGVRPLPR
jgi:hypothetical protein